MGKQYTRQYTNPKQLENLIHEGREPLWDGQPKKRHNITLSDEAWALLQAQAELHDRSISEIIEHMARGFSPSKRRCK